MAHKDVSTLLNHADGCLAGDVGRVLPEPCWCGLDPYLQRMKQARLLRPHLEGVLKPTGIPKWYNTKIPRLDGLTPNQAIAQGRMADVLRVAESYSEPFGFT